MTVSLTPVSHGSGGVGTEPGTTCTSWVASSTKMSWRSTTSNATSWMCMGWASRGGVVELPHLGGAECRVLGDRLRPLSARSRPRRRRSGRRRPCPSTASAGASSKNADSLLEQGQRPGDRRRRQRGVMAGSWRNRGGVEVSTPTAGTTRNCMIWPVVAGSAASKSPPGLTAAERLVGPDVVRARGSRPARW